MGRPKKCRRVSTLPKVSVFGPVDLSLGVDEIIIITVEEYEIIRLIDLDGLSQEQCADSMGVARTTIQRIYDDARTKLADFLINGKILKIEGGDYKICNEFEDKENCNGCIYNNINGKNI